MNNFWKWFFTVIGIVGVTAIIFVKATKKVGNTTVTGPQEAATLMKAGGSSLSEGISALEGN